MKNPTAGSWCASRYWSMIAVNPAQMGAASDVPPPTSLLPFSMMQLPVVGSESAAHVGHLAPIAGVDLTPGAHSGLPRRAARTRSDTPPPVPWDKSGSDHVGLADVVARRVRRQSGAAGARHRRQGTPVR